METIEIINTRRKAGMLLAKQLQSYCHTNAVVVGIPRGGVLVAAEIATALDIPLETLPCTRIKHPADSSKSIGSVSLDEMLIHQFNRDLPQDYILEQVSQIQDKFKREYNFYNEDHKPVSLLDKTVIVVDEMLQSGDTLIACLRSIRRQSPLAIIVAVPFVSAEGALSVQAVVDDVIFIQLDQEIRRECFEIFPKVSEYEVKTALMQLRDRFNEVVHQ